MKMTERVGNWARRNAALITLASMLVLQGASTIWWTAVLSQRVSEVEAKVSRQSPLVDQIPAMRQMDETIAKALDKISCDIGKIGDRMWEIRREPTK